MALSQADVARKVGIDKSHVSHFEAGRRYPDFHNLKALAMVLEVTSDYLLGIDDRQLRVIHRM